MMSDSVAIAASLSFGQSVGSRRSCGRAQRPASAGSEQCARTEGEGGSCCMTCVLPDKKPDGRACQIISSPAHHFSPDECRRSLQHPGGQRTFGGEVFIYTGLYIYISIQSIQTTPEREELTSPCPPAGAELLYRSRDGDVIKYNVETEEETILVQNKKFVSVSSLGSV